MSTIASRSAFYYGFKIDENNRYLDFAEGGPQIDGVLNIGEYTLMGFAKELKRALDASGAQTYTVTVNRTTRIITIFAPGTFSLLVATGTHVGNTPFDLAGFTVTDRTGGNNYAGNLSAGFAYETQFPVSEYVSAEHSKLKESASVNVSAKGEVQTIYFGDGRRVKMNIRLITNKTGISNSGFYSNPNGISDAIDLMDFLISKGKAEFIPNVSDRNSFIDVILESTPQSNRGVAYELKNMAKDVYETGQLLFREVIE